MARYDTAHEMIGIGLVGVGLHGSRYAQHLARGEVSGLRLAAVTRRDRLLGEARARELGCRYHPTLEDLVHDRDVHAVLVSSPAGHHATAVLAAVRAHKPVLVEKPVTHSLEDARELLREVTKGKGRVTVAHTLRWEVAYARATELARELGPVRHAQALYLKGDFTSRSSSESRGDFHRAVYACGIHHLDWAGLLFPQGFERVYATESPSEDGLACTALLEAKGGGTFTLALRLKGAGTEDAFAVLGDGGALLGDRSAHSLVKVGSAGRSSIDLGPPSPALPRVLASFRDHVLGVAENPVPLEAGVRAVARAEACVRSLALGTPVNVEEELPR